MVIGTEIDPSEWTMRADVVVSGAPPPKSSWSFMTTLFPLATGVTEITLFLTVPCSPLSLSTYTHLFPTTSGKNAAAPLPVDMELADPELAGLELADPEPAPGWLLPAGWNWTWTPWWRWSCSRSRPGPARRRPRPRAWLPRACEW